MAKAKPPASKPETAETQSFNGLRITSARNGFRRAGRAWSSEPTTVAMADLSDDQLAMLRAEPMLTVEDVVIEPAAE